MSYHATQTVDIFHIIQLFLSIKTYIGDMCFEIFITLVLSSFISIRQHLPVSISVLVIPCISVSILAGSTKSSAYFTELIMCPPALKSPNPSTASSVMYSHYNSSRIGDKQHSTAAPLPIFTLLLSPLDQQFNILVHVKFVGQFYFASVDTRYLQWFGPAYTVKCLLLVNEAVWFTCSGINNVNVMVKSLCTPPSHVECWGCTPRILKLSTAPLLEGKLLRCTVNNMLV